MQHFQLRLNLLGTLLGAIAGFQILLQFHDFSRNGCDLQLPLHPGAEAFWREQGYLD